VPPEDTSAARAIEEAERWNAGLYIKAEGERRVAAGPHNGDCNGGDTEMNLTTICHTMAYLLRGWQMP
jgi:hypothetical protein